MPGTNEGKKFWQGRSELRPAGQGFVLRLVDQRLALGPAEWLGHRCIEVGNEEALDPLLERLLGGEVAAAEEFAHQDGEPDLDLVEPRGVFGREVESDPAAGVARNASRAAIDWRMPDLPRRDTGANALKHWRWGVGDREPHVLLMLFAALDRIDIFAGQARAAAEGSGLATIKVLGTTDMGGVEPFGFVDGVSQPTFDWIVRARRAPRLTAHSPISSRSGSCCLATTTNTAVRPRARRSTRASGMPACCCQRPVPQAAVGDPGRNGSYLVCASCRRTCWASGGGWRKRRRERARPRRRSPIGGRTPARRISARRSPNRLASTRGQSARSLG